jgi:hypothetical protein
MRRHIYIAGSSPEPILAYSNVANDIIEIRIKHGDNDLQVIEIPCIDFNLCPNVEYQYIYRFRADGVLGCNSPDSLVTFEPKEFAGKPWLGSAQPNINITYNADSSNICLDPTFINFPGTKVYSVNLEGDVRVLAEGSNFDRVVNPIIEGVSIQRYNNPTRDLYDCADDNLPPGGIGSVVPIGATPSNPKRWAAVGVIEYARIISAQSNPDFEVKTGIISTSVAVNSSMLPFELQVSGSLSTAGGGGSVFACNPGDLIPEINVTNGLQGFGFQLKGKTSDCLGNLTNGRSAISPLTGNTYYACRPTGGNLNWTYSITPPNPAFCTEVRTYNPPAPVLLEAYAISTEGSPIKFREYYRLV